MAGGGAYGMAAGIAHAITTEAGPIIATFHGSITMLIRVGGYITGTVIGADSSGPMSESLTNDFDRTGTHGEQVATGNDKEPGA